MLEDEEVLYDLVLELQRNHSVSERIDILKGASAGVDRRQRRATAIVSKPPAVAMANRRPLRVTRQHFQPLRAARLRR
jgi:hypothetical protein